MKKNKKGKKLTHRQTETFLRKLNRTYVRLHHDYEKYFWLSYMGDFSVGDRKNAALQKRDQFRSDKKLLEKTEKLLKSAKGKERIRLQYWQTFFRRYEIPDHLHKIKEEEAALENKVRERRSTRKTGYVDPKTGKLIEASELKIRTMMRTDLDEAVRKACFDAMQKIATDLLPEYIELVRLRNRFAKAAGYEDFYAYKLATDEMMVKSDIFDLFGEIYEKTKFGFENIRKLEQTMPGLRKPWNFSYMMTGDFTKEEDPYFDFGEAMMLWGRSFAALGVDYRKGRLTLDLLDRKGKWSNGFCHWTDIVYHDGKKLRAGSSDFTCNVVPGQVGSGAQGIHTLFHEGGHAAHLLNSTVTEACMNHEYAPQSIAWAETQSMFMDTMFSSIEWKMRYLKDRQGRGYPFELYERKMRKLHPLMPLDFMHFIFVCDFERQIYEADSLDEEKVKKIAVAVHKKYFDQDGESLQMLNVPHIYSWESSAYYHGYGLAELALTQWREYFYKKYGYIVDNKKVGKEMQKVWKLGATKSFLDFVKMATGNKLGANAFVSHVTRPLDLVIETGKDRVRKMEKVPLHKKPVRLNADIFLVHGKEKIADSRKGFEKMAEKYKKWLASLA